LDPFILGKVAMKIDGVWMLNGMAQFAKKPQLGRGPPRLFRSARIDAGKKPITWMGGWCYAIPSTAKQKRCGLGIHPLSQHLQGQPAHGRKPAPDRAEPGPELRAGAASQHQDQRVFWPTPTSTTTPATDPHVKQAMKVYNDMIPVSKYRARDHGGPAALEPAVERHERRHLPQA